MCRGEKGEVSRGEVAREGEVVEEREVCEVAGCSSGENRGEEGEVIFPGGDKWAGIAPVSVSAFKASGRVGERGVGTCGSARVRGGAVAE